ncbi:MAG TPA: energy-coupling factor transporter ATPase [Ruminococcaceae bacterium]|nr:energy-coupling factor transporter ATPase [Oscillospiraceae bacterium]
MSDNTLIKVNSIKKHYLGGEVKALDGIDLEINQGEVVVIIGPSGSGKSTFLRTLNLLEIPTEGHIIFDGEDLTDPKLNINEHRQKMGMVFQHFNLFPNMTVLKNMTIAPMKLLKKSKEDAEQKAMSLLKTVGLEDRANAYPSQLSGGQKQRVSIAGVIAMHPKCIVLDEPTAMLDPKGRKEVIRAVRALNDVERITIILITHYMEEVIYADKVYVMDKGKVTLQGTPREVFSKVEQLKELRLDVPQVTMLAHELQKEGFPMPEGILTKQEFREALDYCVSVMG